MPQCKPEAKEASSVRRSVNGGQGLALQVAQGLVAEPWTVAPPGNRDALSGQQVCRVQGSGPCVACRAQPCHHLRSGLTDLTRDLDFELDPSVLLPQWAHKSCEADDWFGSTRSCRHRANHLDIGNKGCWAAWTCQEEHLWGVRMAEVPPCVAGHRHGPSVSPAQRRPPLPVSCPFCARCLSCLLSLPDARPQSTLLPGESCCLLTPGCPLPPHSAPQTPARSPRWGEWTFSTSQHLPWSP